MIRIEEHQSELKDSIIPKFITHYKGQFKNSIFLQTVSKENKLIYPAANAIALNSLSPSFENQKTQTFFNTLPGSKGIICMTQSANKRYFAWAQETDESPVIFLVDFANPTTVKKKHLAVGQVKGKKYLSLAFNGSQITQPKFLVALTNGPQYQLVQWNFQKGKYSVFTLQKPDNKAESKIISGAVEKYNQIFFFRQEDNLVAMGKGNLKFFKLAVDKVQMKDSPFARREVSEKQYNFTAYCVLKDGLIVGTDNGDLLYFAANGQFKAVLATSPGENYSIETLIYLPSRNKSFLAGGSDGMLFQYEKAQSKQAKNIYIKSERKLSLKQFKGKITSLVATPKQDELFIGLHSGILLKMSLQKTDQFACDHALQSFHTDNINGLDVCLRKSLVATCSTDRSIRIWNYLQKNNLQVMKVFEQKPLSLSFHPSGLHLLVSFPDRVRMINILENELVTYKDILIKNCYEVKFSNGGHLFAVVNNVMVQIYNFYTLDLPSHYQFKAQAGKFQTMTWQDDDLAIYLGTNDGFVFYYKLQDPTCRLQILAAPGFSVKSLACIFVGKDEKQGLINERTVYVGGSFNNLVSQESKCIYQIKITPKSQKDKERQSYRDQLNKYNISTPNKIYTNSNVSKIMFTNSKKVFMYCTDEPNMASTLRYSRYPFHLSRQIYEIQAHTSHISKMAITSDDNYIFTSGQDGQFVCYEFKDKESKIKIQLPDLSQQFLYSKPNLIKQKAELEDLKLKNAEAKQKKQRVMRQTRAENQRLISEWNFKINEREKNQKQKYDKQVQEISRMQKQQNQKLIKLENENKSKRQTVERQYSDKIQLQQTRYSDLGKTKEQDSKKFNAILQKISNQHIKEKQKKEIQFENQLKRQKTQLEKLESEYLENRNAYLGEQQKQQGQSQKIIKGKKEDHDTSVKTLKEQNSIAETNRQIKKVQLQKQDRQLQEEKHHLKHTLEDIDKIKQKHEQNLQKKQSQAKQIEEREKTIRDKMTRINELKKKTQQLEKFKFVLDYKIKELKRDIGPRQQQIAKMKQQIANMNAQIIHFKRTNNNMSLIIKDLVSKRGGMEKEIQTLTQDETQNLNYIKSFQYDLSDMYQTNIKEYKSLKAKVIQLYRKYVQQENKKKMEGIDQQKQFIKQRAHLQSTVKGLKEKFKKSMQLHDSDNRRIMAQNEELICEINDLKRQKKNLKDEIRKKELAKEITSKLQSDKFQLEKQLQNYEKTLRQLKIDYEKKVKRKRQDNPA